MAAQVITVAATGSFVARFRPLGLAWAMAATALLQAATVIPALAEKPPTVALISAFTLPWRLAAALFRAAARRE